MKYKANDFDFYKEALSQLNKIDADGFCDKAYQEAEAIIENLGDDFIAELNQLEVTIEEVNDELQNAKDDLEDAEREIKNLKQEIENAGWK